MGRRLPRRWRRIGLGLGLGLGTALAGIAFARYRSRSRARTGTARNISTDDAITERNAAAFLVSRRLDPDALETIREDVSRRAIDGEPEWLLGVDGATTASLFVDRGREDPELVWYVEISRAELEEWDDPGSTVADAFPVADGIDSGSSTIDRELLVHVVNPARPRTIVPDEPLLEAAELDANRTGDVELVRIDLESGLPERLADRFAGLSRRAIAGELDLGPIESWSFEMLDRENMYTESIFLERRDDGYSLVQYMEAEDMQQVYDAYYDTWNPVARVSELVLGQVLVDPDAILEYPLETEFELLANVTHPDRPRSVTECSGTDTDRTDEPGIEGDDSRT